MPNEHREELLEELRQHVGALIAAQEERGASGEQARDRAFRLFGDPSEVGRKLDAEWQRSHPQTAERKPKYYVQIFEAPGTLWVQSDSILSRVPGNRSRPVVSFTGLFCHFPLLRSRR